MKNAMEALSRLGCRLESWRAEYSAPTPIPQDIWNEARGLAAELGVGRVSRALRLDYSRLKKVSALSGKEPTPAALPSFVELRPLLSEAPGRCVIEVESSRGDRMRLQLENPQCTSLVALVREFLSK